MERELFLLVKGWLCAISSSRSGRSIYSDRLIVLVYYWSVINDRPVSWACVREHWAPDLRPRRLPSQSRMSRRLRSPSVRDLLNLLEERVLRHDRRAPLACAIDGKPLPVGTHTHDKQARWGRGAGGWAIGYKLHLLLSLCGTIMGWRVAPMNVNEREMAKRILRQAQVSGYVLGDKQYDAHHLYEEAGQSGAQLVAPRQRGTEHKIGKQRRGMRRMRSVTILESPVSSYGADLHQMRTDIERKFGYLTSTSGLLTHLPAWVRTHRRVRGWVQAKLVLSELRIIKNRSSEAA